MLSLVLCLNTRQCVCGNHRWHRTKSDTVTGGNGLRNITVVGEEVDGCCCGVDAPKVTNGH